MIKIDTRAKPSRTVNDDLAGHAGNVFWLMDGATQLVQPDHGMDAAWHVGQLAKAFEEALAAQPDMDLAKMARESIAKVSAQFCNATGLTPDSPRDLRPFSTLILCRMADDRKSLDYLLVCDSTLAVIGPSGNTVVSDKRIDLTDPLAGTDALLRAGFGFQSPEFKAEMRNVYNATGKLMNKAGGWDAVAQDPSVIDRAITGTIDLGLGDHILLMSDGFTRAVDTLDIYPSWELLLADIKEKGAGFVLDKIREVEAADANGQKHPRSSIHDDATALWISPAP